MEVASNEGRAGRLTRRRNGPEREEAQQFGLRIHAWRDERFRLLERSVWEL